MKYKSPEELVEKIIKLLQVDNYESATQLVEHNLEIMEENIVQECLGNFAFYRRNMPDAIKHYENAINLKPDRVISRYQFLVGLINHNEQDMAAALIRYQNAIDTDPDFIEPYIFLKKLLMTIDSPDDAKVCQEHIDRIREISQYDIEKIEDWDHFSESVH